jgi:hypothetical protein
MVKLIANKREFPLTPMRHYRQTRPEHNARGDPCYNALQQEYLPELSTLGCRESCRNENDTGDEQRNTEDTKIEKPTNKNTHGKRERILKNTF